MTTAKTRRRRKFRKPELAAIRLPSEAEIPRPDDDPGEWGPNELAAAKLMPPPVENLWVRGLIEAEQYQAAHEIERVFHWATSGLQSRLSRLGMVRGSGGDGSDPLQAAYATRYRPWADELSACRAATPELDQIAQVLHSVPRDELPGLAAKAADRPKPRRDRRHPKTLQFVIAFVIDGRTIASIARQETHAHGTVKQAIFDGLTLYARIAGWLRRAA